MRIGGIHIIDEHGMLTSEKNRKIWGLQKSIDEIAEKYIENHKRLNVLFLNNTSPEINKKLTADAYHFAELEINSFQVLHQGDLIWSIFNREESNLSKKAEQISKKLFMSREYLGIHLFTVEISDVLFAAKGYIDGILSFDFQAGSLLNHISLLPFPVQKQYLDSRRLEKCNPQLIEDFFQTKRQDLLEKIYSETSPEHLVALFEEMLSMQLFYNFKY